MGDFTFRLSAYEGPIDLLYHLIQKNEINIYDIPISEIADQYIACLNIADQQDETMDTMSEFLVLAATLLEIKSKMLLPHLIPKEEEQGDPRMDLVARLLTYQRYKNGAQLLKARESFGNQIVFRAQEAVVGQLSDPMDPQKMLSNMSIDALYELFKDTINRKELKVDKIRSSFNAVIKDHYTIEDKIEQISSRLSEEQKLSFKQLIYLSTSKIESVVLFLAMLEMIRSGLVSIRQNHLFDDITIEKVEVPSTTVPRTEVPRTEVPQ